MEGALWGFCGGLLAPGALWLIDRLFAATLSSLLADVVGGLPVRLFAPDVALGLLAGGVLLGTLGSALAVRRFLEEQI